MRPGLFILIHCGLLLGGAAARADEPAPEPRKLPALVVPTPTAPTSTWPTTPAPAPILIQPATPAPPPSAAIVSPIPPSGPAPNAPPPEEFPFRFRWDNGLFGETPDGAFSFRVGGRFDFDSGWYSTPQELQDELNVPLLDGTALRRFRLGVDGKAWGNLEFKLEADFSRASDFKSTTDPQATVFITDAWVALRDLPYLDVVKAGHQKEYLSFNNATSSRFMPFMERPFIFDAYENDYSFGSGVSTSRTYWDEHATSWFGVFWNGTQSQAFNVGDGYAASGRLTWMPLNDRATQQWVNFSASASMRSIRTIGETVTVRPLVRTGQRTQVPNLIDTNELFGTDGLQVASVGAHSAWGPFTFGGEYMCRHTPSAYVELPAGPVQLGDLFFNGFYVEALYFLTPGDHRPINPVTPGYDRIVPVRSFLCSRSAAGLTERGWGAWEVGCRLDHVDVNSGLAQAGVLDAFTLGLNWHLNGNATLMLNYVYTKLDGALGAPVAGVPATRANGNFNALGLRFHVDF